MNSGLCEVVKNDDPEELDRIIEHFRKHELLKKLNSMPSINPENYNIDSFNSQNLGPITVQGFREYVLNHNLPGLDTVLAQNGIDNYGLSPLMFGPGAGSFLVGGFLNGPESIIFRPRKEGRRPPEKGLAERSPETMIFSFSTRNVAERDGYHVKRTRFKPFSGSQKKPLGSQDMSIIFFGPRPGGEVSYARVSCIGNRVYTRFPIQETLA